MKTFEGIDTSCKTTDRKFFPYCGRKENFFIIINKGQDYIKPELEPLKINFKKIKGVPHFTLDTELKDEHGNIIKVKDVKKKTVIFCPFCDHKDRGNPDGHNASIQLNPTGEPSIYCASCESRGKGINGTGVYTLDNNEAFLVQSEKLEVPVFRDILSDKYYIGDKSKRTGIFEYHSIAKMNIPNALKNRSMAIPDKYPEVEFDYDFANRIRQDLSKGFVNRYVCPEILLAEPNKNVFVVPQYTKKVMQHIVGNSQEVYESLINHLAHMVQTGNKLRVAFLFQTCPGTGKGILFNYSLAQIFGRLYCTQIQHRSFLKEFNQFLEHNYLVMVDEIEADFTSNSDALARILKQVIGDRHIAVESKGVDIKNGKINANLFFATNKRNGLTLEPSDRRFIIGNWQNENAYERKWWLGDDEIKKQLIKEVPQFVGYLKGHVVDMDTLNRVVKNEARQVLIDLSKTNTTMFFESVRAKEWDWLRDNLKPFNPKSTYENDIYYYTEADIIVDKGIPIDRIHRDELRTIYNNIFQTNKNANEFTRLCKLNGLEIKPMKIDGYTTNQQGYKWK
ncbi:primase-helicase family protein [Candidatus Neomarinimicrobiota bacterium]